MDKDEWLKDETTSITCQDLGISDKSIFQSIDKGLGLGFYEEDIKKLQDHNLKMWHNLTYKPYKKYKKKYYRDNPDSSKKFVPSLPNILKLTDDMGTHIPIEFIYEQKCGKLIYYFNLIEIMRQLLVISCISREFEQQKNFSFIYNPITQLPFTPKEIIILRDLFTKRYYKWKQSQYTKYTYTSANRIYYLSQIIYFISKILDDKENMVYKYLAYFSTILYSTSSLCELYQCLYKSSSSVSDRVLESVGMTLYNLYLFENPFTLGKTISHKILSLFSIHIILYNFTNLIYEPDIQTTIEDYFNLDYPHKLYKKYLMKFRQQHLEKIILSGHNIIALQALEINSGGTHKWKPTINEMIHITDQYRQEFIPLYLLDLENKYFNICPNIVKRAQRKIKYIPKWLKMLPKYS